ncbi:MAG: hypothetical protein WBM44_19630 [Waterburya sp.]
MQRKLTPIKIELQAIAGRYIGDRAFQEIWVIFWCYILTCGR